MIPKKNFKRFFYKTLKQPDYAFGVFKKRLAAHLNYRFGLPKKAFPEAVTLFLTHQCNLRCRMCGQWGDKGITKMFSGKPASGQLSVEDFKRVIREISVFKPNITLFGGEPLLYAGCLDLIRQIKQLRLHCLMITNGSLLERYAEEIVASGLDELNLSLDGATELHDEIRGMSGLFDKIMRGLKQVQYYKTSLKKKMPLVNLQCTISRFNYLYLEQMVRVAEEARADSLTFHNLIFLSNEIIEKQKKFDRLLNSSSLEWEGFVFDPGIDPKVLNDKIREISSGKYGFKLDFYPNFSSGALEEYYKNPDYLPREYACRCLSPWMAAYIFPDGEIRPCLNFDYSFGNIKEGKFSEFWFGEKAKTFRRLLRENKLFPVCIRCTELYRY